MGAPSVCAQLRVYQHESLPGAINAVKNKINIFGELTQVGLCLAKRQLESKLIHGLRSDHS